MEPSLVLTEAILLSPAAYHPPLPASNTNAITEPEWSHSFLNPRNRIDSLDIISNPTWDIDGAEPDGRQIWAIPRFARNKHPRRIDVYIGDLADPSNPSLAILKSGSLQLCSRKAACESLLCRHVLRALEFWSERERFGDFEEEYMALPFGSQIAISSVEVELWDMEITFLPVYGLEQQWLFVKSLQEIWGLDEDALPPSIDVGELRFQKQLYDSIGLMEIAGKEGELLVLKTISLDTKALYHELKVLLTMPPHPNASPPPLYLITKKVRFGGKRGVCGLLMMYYPLGTVDQLRRSGARLAQSLLLQWAKQLTEAMIHVRDSPARFYSDLNPRNIALSSRGGALQLVLIDHDQRTPGYTRRHPKSNTSLPLKPWRAPKSLIALSRKDSCLARIARPYLGAIRSVGAVFKGIQSVAGFRLLAGCPTFPNFDKTPKELKSVIRDRTAGADEWEGVQQPFVIRGSRIYARDLETGELSDSVTALQESTRSWWKFEIDRARGSSASERQPPVVY
ncbi:hypothetical protein IFR05_003876 [Cadophora sp. M221]|nr:hypothetical protein IFR05_003876 [Cadophora sp. M221]